MLVVDPAVLLDGETLAGGESHEILRRAALDRLGLRSLRDDRAEYRALLARVSHGLEDGISVDAVAHARLLDCPARVFHRESSARTFALEEREEGLHSVVGDLRLDFGILVRAHPHAYDTGFLVRGLLENAVAACNDDVVFLLEILVELQLRCVPCGGGYGRTVDVHPGRALDFRRHRGDPLLGGYPRGALHIGYGKLREGFDAGEEPGVLGGAALELLHDLVGEKAHRKLDFAVGSGHRGLTLGEDIAVEVALRAIVEGHDVLFDLLELHALELAFPKRVSEGLEIEGLAPAASLADVEDRLALLLEHHDVVGCIAARRDGYALDGVPGLDCMADEVGDLLLAYEGVGVEPLLLGGGDHLFGGWWRV